MKPLINETTIHVIIFGTITSLTLLLVGCTLASELSPNPNYMRWVFGSVGFIVGVVVYLINVIMKYQAICDKFIED